MRVIVTGAAGFLGSHLALHHLKQGDQVIGVDNFCSSLGTFDSPSPHLSQLLSCPGFFLSRHDIASKAFIDEFHPWEGDIIYNFACPASPPRYQAMPVETMLTCVVGTRNVLEIARQTGAKVVHASTSEVYGDPTITPQPESYRGCV